MSTAVYTPGHSQNASDFMATRSLSTHGAFFAAHLAPGLSVLDCGCGPGSITLGIAAVCAPGRVVGVDFGASQIERAQAAAAAGGIGNVEFRTADGTALPFADASFDRVFSHALMEHLADPGLAAREFHRVLKPGGMAGVCSPDWGGFVLAPPSPALSAAIDAYTRLQSRNGGDGMVGRKLGTVLRAAGFEDVAMTARYECYPALTFIGEYLALQLDRAGDATSAATLRAWSQSSGGLFAQCWVSAVGRKKT